MVMKMLTGDVREIATTLLKQDWVLSDFEVLQIAVKIQQNQILSEAFGVTDSNKYPKFLEAIALGIGFDKNQDNQSIANSIEFLTETLRVSLDEIKE